MLGRSNRNRPASSLEGHGLGDVYGFGGAAGGDDDGAAFGHEGRAFEEGDEAGGG